MGKTMRVENLPPGWQTVRLGQVSLLRAETIQPDDHPNIPYIGLEHIDSGNPKINRYGDPSDVRSAKSRFYKGDVLFGKLRPYLEKAALAEFEGMCSTDILVLKATDAMASEFLVHVTHTSAFTEHAITTTKGVNHPRTSWSSLAEFPLALPPLPEQRAIARALRAVQEAKEARRREVAVERERKAALMQHLFTHGTRNEPRTQTAIGEIPESWRVARLGTVATIVSGGTPDRSNPDYWSNDIPWVKTGEINYRPITQTGEFVSKEGLANSSARVIPAGTLLMAMYGQGVTRGRVAILGIDAAINQACAAILASPEVSPDFLYHFLTYNYENIRNLGHGANQKNLNAALIKSIVLALPSQCEQSEIADALSPCDAKIAALEREAGLLDELFRATLEELMDGRLSAGE